MKKSFLLASIIATLFLSGTVSAVVFRHSSGVSTSVSPPGGLRVQKTYRGNSFRMLLVEKDSSWNLVEDGAWGLLQGFFGRYLTFRGSGLEPNTDYTLIYYGDATHNDVWPYATCIRKITTSSNGRIGLTTTRYDYSSFIGDGVGQKIWLILSSDVNCDAGQMTAWNPSEYLFEWDTI